MLKKHLNPYRHIKKCFYLNTHTLYLYNTNGIQLPSSSNMDVSITGVCYYSRSLFLREVTELDDIITVHKFRRWLLFLFYILGSINTKLRFGRYICYSYFISNYQTNFHRSSFVICTFTSVSCPNSTVSL